MNLVGYSIKESIRITLEERYYNPSYRTLSTIADIRKALIQEHRFESIRLRETPGAAKISSWEFRVNGKTYFYDYNHSSSTLTFVGVR